MGVLVSDQGKSGESRGPRLASEPVQRSQSGSFSYRYDHRLNVTCSATTAGLSTLPRLDALVRSMLNLLSGGSERTRPLSR